jgi:H+-transporting ATP synthase F0 complex subunit s
VTGSRPIFGWLNAIFNQVDETRVKAVGPDLAAAEWLIRCGAGVKWSNTSGFTKEYNALPKHTSEKIIAIDATDSCVMSVGFPYLRGLKAVKEVKLNKCYYLDDDSLNYLKNLKSSLERLEIVSCGNITPTGLEAVKSLKNLKTLVLFDLPEVPRDQVLPELKAALPSTEINFEDAEKKEEEKK